MRVGASLVSVVVLMCLMSCAGRVASGERSHSRFDATQDRIRELSRLYSGTIDAHTTGRAAWENLERADSLMAQWGAINFSLDDVRALFGSPTKESDDLLEYEFDTGFSGAIWRFRAEQGRIVSVERLVLN